MGEMGMGEMEAQGNRESREDEDKRQARGATLLQAYTLPSHQRRTAYLPGPPALPLLRKRWL
jgi:hypothetical protein